MEALWKHYQYRGTKANARRLCEMHWAFMRSSTVRDIVRSYIVSCGPFYKHGLTLIPAWISNYILRKVWDQITYPFLNINGATGEI